MFLTRVLVFLISAFLNMILCLFSTLLIIFFFTVALRQILFLKISRFLLLRHVSISSPEFSCFFIWRMARRKFPFPEETFQLSFFSAPSFISKIEKTLGKRVNTSCIKEQVDNISLESKKWGIKVAHFLTSLFTR